MNNETKNLSKIILTLIATSSLAGCSLFYGENGLIKDRSHEYLDATQTKDIVMPEGLSQRNRANFAEVPPIGETAHSGEIGHDLNKASPVQILDVLENVRVDKNSEIPAVFLNEDESFLWKTLLELFTDNEIKLAEVNEQTRAVDTGWIAVDERGVWLGLEAEDEIDDFRVRYQINLSAGDIKGETRLQVNRSQAQKLNDDTEKWDDVGGQWRESVQMLNYYLANYNGKAKERERLLRESTLTGFKVELGADNDNAAALITSTNREDVWLAIPATLKSLKIEVTDKDRRSRTYYLKYEKEEVGFFASLFSEKKAEFQLPNGNYQVVLSEQGENTTITFKDGQGGTLDAKLIVQIFPFLAEAFAKKHQQLEN